MSRVTINYCKTCEKYTQFRIKVSWYRYQECQECGNQIVIRPVKETKPKGK